MIQAKQIYQRVQLFLTSLKGVVVTTYRVIPLRQKNPKTRAEVELIRENNESLVPTVFLALSQFVPVLGNLPVLLAISYPRQMLSKSYWDDNLLTTIRNEEYAEKEASRQILLNIIGNKISRQYQPPPVNELQREHLVHLARANALYANSFVYKTIPPFTSISTIFIRNKLSKRVQEIQADDEMLVAMSANGGLESMASQELLTACTRRGASPTLQRDELIAYLLNWLSSSVHKTSSSEGSCISSFSHALALPQVFKHGP